MDDKCQEDRDKQTNGAKQSLYQEACGRHIWEEPTFLGQTETSCLTQMANILGVYLARCFHPDYNSRPVGWERIGIQYRPGSQPSKSLDSLLPVLC
jgi:hypothetical protein